MQHKFIISGGGTGGHIFPALAIADELKKQLPDCEIQFVGAVGRMEMEKVPQAGYPITGLKVQGLKRSLSLQNFSVIGNLIGSYFKARKILKEVQPNCVIGTGGYASLPILYAAGHLGIPMVIWEGNGFAGLTNKLVAKFASAICTGLPGMEKYFPKDKIRLTGNPVRKEFVNKPAKDEALQFFQLNQQQPVILITGGSLGAKSINEAVKLNFQNLIDSGFQLIWQTGKSFDGKEYNHPQAKVMTFLKEMNMAYAAADIVISRAGALSIAEITVSGKPSILIPSPNVTDDHQTKNAQVLANNNAAIVIPDQDIQNKLLEAVVSLANDKNKIETLQQNAHHLSKPNATEDIVKIIMEVMKK